MANKHYEALGLSDDASLEDIQTAYKQLVAQYHPDINPDNPDAAKRFKEISEAYDALIVQKEQETAIVHSPSEVPAEAPSSVVDPKKKKKKNSLSMANILKVKTKVFFIVLWRIIFYLLIGIVLNFVLYLFVDPKISLMLDSPRLAFYWRIIGYLLLNLFLVIFPIFYFMLGKRNGAHKAINYLLDNVKEFLFVYLVDRFFKWVAKKPAIQADLNDNKLNVIMNDVLPKYIKTLPNMGPIMRSVYKIFNQKFNFKELIMQEIDKMGGRLDEESLKNHVFEEATRKVPLIILKDKAQTYLFVLIAFNILVFVLVRFVLPLPL